MKRSVELEEYAKAVGVPVEELANYKNDYQKMMESLGDCIYIPDFAFDYLDVTEFRLFTQIMADETYPDKSIIKVWDPKIIKKYTRIPMTKLNKARYNLLMMGLIKPSKNKKHLYSINYKNVNRLAGILYYIDEMDYWRKFREYIGLKPAKNITIKDVMYFMEMMEKLK